VQPYVLQYQQLTELTRELKALGANNRNPGRPGGLTGRARLRALTQAYEDFRQADGSLPATYQVAQVILQLQE
jgi:malonyl-CoA O-methyltransferase